MLNDSEVYKKREIHKLGIVFKNQNFHKKSFNLDS